MERAAIGARTQRAEMISLQLRKRKQRLRPLASLRPSDFDAHPIWRFVTVDEPDETWVRPIASRRTASLSEKVVGTQVTLADGRRCPAVFSNVAIDDPELTEHFLTLSLFVAGKWFHLSRYHDVDARRKGPTALAAALRRPIAKVFPIRYDLRPYVKNGPAWLEGAVNRLPRKRLTRAQVIALAVAKLPPA